MAGPTALPSRVAKVCCTAGLVLITPLSKMAAWATLGKLEASEPILLFNCVDAGGLVFDFHSLRCQCATLADQAGVTPRVVQKLMRHSTLELTGRYTRPRAVDIERAAESMPSLRPDADRSNASTLAATGTDPATHQRTFAPYLIHSGDDSSRIRSHADVTIESDEPATMNRLTTEKTGEDAFCRGDSHRVVEYRGGDSNPRPADYETAALAS